MRFETSGAGLSEGITIQTQDNYYMVFIDFSKALSWNKEVKQSLPDSEDRAAARRSDEVASGFVS